MSDDLKTNYTKLNKKYQELKQQLAEKEEFLHNRDKWIAELERQVNLSRSMERVALKGCKELEEKLKEVEGQYAYECECNKQFVECQNENEKLKQQLAEKDAEIRVVYSFRKQKCDNLQKALAEKERQVKKLNNEAQKYFEDAYCNDFHNQDKISFAIAELEKVKSAFGLINSKLDKVETIKEYIHYIDHQINELKGKVEDVKD